MKKILKKADEMEMAINMKAARFAFGFLEIAIMDYCIATKVITGEFPTLLFIFGIPVNISPARGQQKCFQENNATIHYYPPPETSLPVNAPQSVPPWCRKR